jgi:hypothetical protein
MMCGGKFSLLKNRVTVFSHTSCFDSTLIHELTHAVCFSSFSKPFLLSLANNQESFFSCDPQLVGLPCPESATEQFNPAYLKFRQCVKNDLNQMRRDESFKDFFSSIERNYQKNILNKTALGEIFSFYMGTRVLLLQQFPKKNVMEILERNFPYLHVYFEADI